MYSRFVGAFRAKSSGEGSSSGGAASSSAGFQGGTSRLGRQLLSDVSGLEPGVEPLFQYFKEYQVPCTLALDVLPHLVEREASPLPEVHHPKSLREVEASWGVVGAYNIIHKAQEELNAFFERQGSNPNMDWAFLDQLFSLFLLSKHSGGYLDVFRSFESFSVLIDNHWKVVVPRFYWAINNFLDFRVSSHLVNNDFNGFLYGLENKDLTSWLIHERRFVTENRKFREKNIVKEYWLDCSVSEEVSALKRIGYPDQRNFLFHSTGSAALHGIAQFNAILAAREVLRRNGDIQTGEFVSCLGSDGVSISGGSGGLGQVYTLRNSDLSDNTYSTIRWFDEFPVTFGIDVQAQQELNEENGIDNICGYSADRKGNGVLVGPEVPLKNVRVVCAPKANEYVVSQWISRHCPHAQFISKEAATIFRKER